MLQKKELRMKLIKTKMKTITLTDEELKELCELLNTEISDYLDTSLVIIPEEGKQLAIRKANIYKRIYKKLIKPIFKVKE